MLTNDIKTTTHSSIASRRRYSTSNQFTNYPTPTLLFHMTTTTTTTNPSSSDSFVLYYDHAGHLAPLSQCFHATASRCLSSLSGKHPPTTTTLVDSAYCPQCLLFHDAATAASYPFCTTCHKCPLCQSVASVAMEHANASTDANTNTTVLFKCGYCSWTSKECQLTVRMDDILTGHDNATGELNDKNQTNKTLLKAQEELILLLKSRKTELESESTHHYNTMLNALEKMALEKEKSKAKTTATNTYSSEHKRQLYGPWSLQSLEATIQKTRHDMVARKQTIIGGQPLTLVQSTMEQTMDESLSTITTTTLLLQATASTDISGLLPLPMPLRPRLSRKCRAEIRNERPGILVKPKLNPLEGDSSLKTGHGQWWKKDASAIHVIPKVAIVKTIQGMNATTGNTAATTTTTTTTILVKVTNPTLGVVKLRLGPSTTERAETAVANNEEWANVLVDSLSGRTVDIDISGTTTPCIAFEPTKMATLEPVEDSFLGIQSTQEPSVIRDFVTSGKTQLVATQADTAWFEVVADGTATSETIVVIISLQIQVGDGSWESSLIAKNTTARDGDKIDFCTFDVVLVNTK